MCGGSADSVPQAVLERMAAAGSLLVVTHARPDGDGLGSMRALALAARSAGKGAWMLVPDSVPARYQFLFATEALQPAGRFAELAGRADLVVVLDTSVAGQLDGLDRQLPAVADKLIVMDHHATPGELGGTLWNDPGAAALGVMIAELIDALGWPIDQDAREALMTAIVSDTGWFRFSNTDGRCLRLAARLLEAGVRADSLYRRLFQSDRPERLKLMARMLQSLELHEAGRLAVMTIRKADFADTGARPEDTENLINEAMRIGSVEAVVLLVETDGHARVSLRSRKLLDVAEVAKRFGGGGHARAAGIRASETIDAIKPRILKTIADELRRLTRL